MATRISLEQAAAAAWHSSSSSLTRDDDLAGHEDEEDEARVDHAVHEAGEELRLVLQEGAPRASACVCGGRSRQPL